jgi:hypothetical protein
MSVARRLESGGVPGLPGHADEQPSALTRTRPGNRPAPRPGQSSRMMSNCPA